MSRFLGVDASRDRTGEDAMERLLDALARHCARQDDGRQRELLPEPGGLGLADPDRIRAVDLVQRDREWYAARDDGRSTDPVGNRIERLGPTGVAHSEDAMGPVENRVPKRFPGRVLTHEVEDRHLREDHVPAVERYLDLDRVHLHAERPLVFRREVVPHVLLDEAGLADGSLADDNDLQPHAAKDHDARFRRSNKKRTLQLSNANQLAARCRAVQASAASSCE